MICFQHDKNRNLHIQYIYIYKICVCPRFAIYEKVFEEKEIMFIASWLPIDYVLAAYVGPLVLALRRGAWRGAARTASGHRRRRGARGGREGGDRMAWGHIEILYKVPADYTKPRKTIKRHKILDKAPKRLYEEPEILYKDINY